MSQWWASLRNSGGVLATSASSTSRGVLPGASPVRLATRKMCVSTAISVWPNTMLRMILAVLRPTPGSASSEAVAGKAATVALDQLAAQADEVLRLGVVEPDAADVGLQALDPEREDRLRRVRYGEEDARCGVDALVGGMRRQHDRDQQLEGRVMLELGGGRGVRGPEAPIDGGACRSVHRSEE